MNKEDWYNLYKNNESKLYKLVVSDRSIFKCDVNETQLIQTKNIKEDLDKLMKEYNCYIFVRPSGTEELLRVYIEKLDENNDFDFSIIFNKIKKIF